MVAALLVAAQGLTAQGRGTLLGEVSEESGQALANATVELSNADGEVERRQLTNADGRFIFPDLPAGVYGVRAEHPGYGPVEEEAVEVQAGETSWVELTLSTAPFELEGVDVLVSTVTISPIETEFKTQLTEEAIELLPIGYSAEDMIEYTPGARKGHVWGGATDQANNYQLDGVAANHPGVGGGMIEPSISWIESLEVVGLGSGAEHGNFQGGLVDVTTKSGTNRLQGAVRATGQGGAMNSSNLGEFEIGSEVASRYDAEGEIRGPIFRDHLFYFAAGQWRETDIRHLNHLRAFESRFLPTLEERAEGKFFGKLTWTPTTHDRLDLSGGTIRLRTDNYGQTGYEAPGAAWLRETFTNFYGARWRHSFGSAGVLEAKVAAFERDEQQQPYAGESVPGIQTYGIQPPYDAYQNAPIRLRHAPESLSGSLSGRFNIETWGITHLLKVGGEYSMGAFTDERIRTGGMTWRPPRMSSLDPEDPDSWTFSSLNFIPSTWGGEVRLYADVENNAVYVQNYMTLTPRLTVSPGVRYGRWKGWMRPSGREEDRFLVVKDDAYEGRIGATFDISGDNTFVAKAHWGRYHQSLLAQMFDRVGGGNVFTNEQTWYYRGETFDDPTTTFTEEERDQLAEAGLFTLEEEIILNETGPIEDYRQPYVDQWVLGLEKTFAGRVKFSAVYVNRRNHDMVALVDRNRDENYTVYEHVRVLDSGGTEVLYNGVKLKLNKLYLRNDVLRQRLVDIAEGRCDGCAFPPGMTFDDTLNLSYDPDYVLTNVPQARREFDQLQLSLTGSFETWGFTGSVVFTRLMGNLDNVTGYDDPSGFGAGPFVRVNESVNSYGWLDNSADRELKLSVYGELPWGIRGGVFWKYAVGDHYSPQFTLSGLQYRYATFDDRRPIDHKFVLPLAGHNVFVGQRGYREYENWATVDARLEREFDVGGTGLVLTLEAYNLLNDDTVIEHNRSVNHGKNFYYFLSDRGAIGGADPNDYFQAVQERIAPRRLRLGLLVRF